MTTPNEEKPAVAPSGLNVGLDVSDIELLNFLEAMGKQTGFKWIARPSINGRGWRLHQDPVYGIYETARAAIVAVMTPNEKLRGCATAEPDNEVRTI